MVRRLRSRAQKSAYSSPWPLRERIAMAVWSIAWLFLVRPTPKFLNSWRLAMLRLFGCRMKGRPFVSESSRIKMPWRLFLEDRACLGPHAEIYNLDSVVLRARSTVAQYAYLCGGTHDFAHPEIPLQTGRIVVGRDAFVGARAILLPGITIGDAAVIGAGAVVTRDMPPGMICAGNPCKPLKSRFTKEPPVLA